VRRRILVAMSRRSFALPALVAFALSASPSIAQTPRVDTVTPACLPREAHAVVGVAVTGVAEPGEGRVYFRRHGHGDFYWVPVEGPREPWAVLPLPEPDNRSAEIYAALVAPDGRLIAQSRPVTVPIEDGCRGEAPNAEQGRRAQALTVGETTLAQRHRKLAWWRCEGIRERIDVAGERRDDDACSVLAWWERPELLLPFGVVGGGVVLVDDGGDTPDDRELSPFQP
jgi:hypothetical protein